MMEVKGTYYVLCNTIDSEGKRGKLSPYSPGAHIEVTEPLHKHMEKPTSTTGLDMKTTEKKSCNSRSS